LGINRYRDRRDTGRIGIGEIQAGKDMKWSETGRLGQEEAGRQDGIVARKGL
jgi:hypothetical protein